MQKTKNVIKARIWFKLSEEPLQLIAFAVHISDSVPLSVNVIVYASNV